MLRHHGLALRLLPCLTLPPGVLLRPPALSLLLLRPPALLLGLPLALLSSLAPLRTLFFTRALPPSFVLMPMPPLLPVG